VNRVAVVDASVGVKWFKDEAGSSSAWELIERHAGSEVDLHMPAQCVGEVLAVIARTDSADAAVSAWVVLDMAGIGRHELDDALMREARAEMRRLGCDFYDALAPALATVLGAVLWSADRRAHGGYPGVQLVGE